MLTICVTELWSIRVSSKINSPIQSLDSFALNDFETPWYFALSAVEMFHKHLSLVNYSHCFCFILSDGLQSSENTNQCSVIQLSKNVADCFLNEQHIKPCSDPDKSMEISKIIDLMTVHWRLFR